ncbi:MAG: cyclic nucleotide-binding domain-containing protein [Bdellovibrio sp.]|nr:MAG: cyclic nucleotide-binding domain-containing protein [Bdellovibrio sp.]
MQRELIQPQWIPHQKQISDHEILIQAPGKTPIRFDIKYKNYVVPLLESQNIAQTVQHIYQQKRQVSFKRLYQIIQRFCQNGYWKNASDFLLPKPQDDGSFFEGLKKLFTPPASMPKPPPFDPFKELPHLPPFHNLPVDVVNNLLKDHQIRQYPRGGIVCSEKAIDRNMFLLISGHLGVFRNKELIVDLRPRSLFGENGFFYGSPRTATVMALEPSQVLIFKWHSAYSQSTLDTPRFQALQNHIWLLQTLQSSPLFKDLPLEALAPLPTMGRIIDIPPKHWIIQEGSLPDFFYLIIQGEAQAFKNGVLKRPMKRGDVFGEIALLQNLRRTASVQTTTPLKAFQVPKDQFWKMLAHNLFLALQIEKTMKARLS